MDATGDRTAGTEARSQGQRSPRSPRAAIVTAVAALVIVGVWRVSYGAELSDDGHLVALAMRLSRGDVLFVDEMGIWALGSIPAIPFTRAWLSVFGATGLVFASRVFFLVCLVAVGWLVYRALRLRFRPMTAFSAAVIPLLMWPYHVPLVSYNTVPLMAIVLATAAGYAALAAGSRAWGFLLGVAAASSVAALPQFAPGALALGACWALLARSRTLISAAVAGTAVVSLPLVLYVALVPGFGAVARSLEYAIARNPYEGPPPLGRMADTIGYYAEGLLDAKYLPLLILIILTAFVPISRPAFAYAATFLPLALIVPSWVEVAGTGSAYGFAERTAVVGVLLAWVGLVPVLRWSLLRGDGRLTTLLCLSVPASLLQTLVMSAATGGSPHWGTHGIGSAPLVMTVTAGLSDIALSRRCWSALLFHVPLVCGFVSLLVLTPFKEPLPWQTSERLATGPFAGLATSSTRAELFEDIKDSRDRWTVPGEGVLTYGLPGAYLFFEESPWMSHQLWLRDYGDANHVGVDYLRTRPELPQLVLLDKGWVTNAGGWDELAERDPIIGLLRSEYEVKQEYPSGLVALVRATGAA